MNIVEYRTFLASKL